MEGLCEIVPFLSLQREWVGQSFPCNVDAHATRNRRQYGGLPEKFSQCHKPDRYGRRSEMCRVVACVRLLRGLEIVKQYT